MFIWLEGRLIRNRMRSRLSNPRRLIIWLLLSGGFAMIFGYRVVALIVHGHVWLSPRALNGFSVAALGRVLEQFVPGVLLALVGVAMRVHPDRAPVPFSSPGEAYLFLCAKVGSRTALAWLLLRSTRWLVFTTVFWLALLYVPGWGAETAGIPWLAAAILLVQCLYVAVGVAGFGVIRRFPRIPVRRIGTATIAVGLLSMVPAAFGAVARPGSSPLWASRVTDLLPPGPLVVATAQGHLWALLLLLAATIGLLGGGAWLASDCYPELWTASTRFFDVRRAARGGRQGLWRVRQPRSANPEAIARSATSASEHWAPQGSWVIAWKEFLALKRGRGGLGLQGAILAAALVGGAAVGVINLSGSRAGAIVVALVIVFTILFSAFTRISLTADVGNTLYWVSGQPVWRRLGVFLLCRALRFAVPLAVFLVTVVLISERDPTAIVLIPILVLISIMPFQVVALASHAALPASSDRRQAQLLRLLLSYAWIILAGLGTIPGRAMHNSGLEAGGAIAVALAELAIFFVFAAWRIERGAAAFAGEERA
jgi:hypothetical protein